jgi:integrase
VIPSKRELAGFCSRLETARDRVLFLLIASSGLRRSEALSLHRDDVDLETCMIKPKPHTGRIKRAFISFVNSETIVALKEYQSFRKDNNQKLFPMATFSDRRLWTNAREATGLQLKPHMLREWFCMEMGCLGVPDRFIDAFCGRVPTSVIARHYTDYSPQRLKEIYDKANLRIL